VAGSQLLLLDRIEEQIAGGAACVTGAELLLAVQDALSEANADNGDRSAMRTADAQEAASELALYLRMMASDFRAIDDLSSERPSGGPRSMADSNLSPAHFSHKDREQELELWARRRIKTLSFATVANSPFAFPEGRPAPVWELTKFWTYPEVARISN